MVSLNAVAFDYVGIDSTLSKKFDIVELAGFLLEYSDKFSAYYLALLFGLTYSRELVQKTIRSVYVYKVRVHLIAEDLYYLFGLAFPEKSVIYMDTNELPADCLYEQSSHYGAVNSARERKKHLLVTDLFPERLYLFLNEGLSKLFRCDPLHIFRSYV